MEIYEKSCIFSLMACMNARKQEKTRKIAGEIRLLHKEGGGKNEKYGRNNGFELLFSLFSCLFLTDFETVLTLSTHFSLFYCRKNDFFKPKNEKMGEIFDK